MINLLGKAVGNTAANAVQGRLNAQNAVENNAMNRLDGLTTDERNRLRLVKKYGTDIQIISEKISNGSILLTKELADYIYTINTNPNLVITVHNKEPVNVVLIEKKRGWRPNKSVEGEQVHSARVAYNDFSNWSVLGKVIVSKDKNNRYRIIPDRYDFEWQSGLSKLPRNIETILGSPGAGVPFTIKYTGEPNVKD
ncbi:VENN motif pre-toxin domain-containing protein [Neisseria leonii]|uniref:VENN motif pre-toxin domain-containing protein n=1 Tax=Neisseria leonii TaxID=2995413 RepID=A0A9X4E3W3_9NEIS|nr:VENN motif pre-toxin domain-containing protein [Neisseria sp. 51.81]MDD9328739.1 VENN motif pre-toxin domain-containing protein [Neisseria sp. 51.81]